MERVRGPVPTMIGRLAARLGAGPRWPLYLGASAAALAADAGLFLILLGLGTSALIASATGYLAGILVHWPISSRIIFADGAAPIGSSARARQKLLFVASTAVGLALTTAIVGGSEGFGFDPRIAKLVAIAASFQTVYLVRRWLVFRAFG